MILWRNEKLKNLINKVIGFMEIIVKKWSFLNQIFKEVREHFIRKEYITYKDDLDESINEILLSWENNNINIDKNSKDIISFLNKLYNNFLEYSNIENFIWLIESYKKTFENIVSDDINKTYGQNINNILEIYYMLYNFESTINPNNIWFILMEILNKYNDENYIVGGYTRDTLLWMEAKDIDVVSTLNISEIEKILLSELPAITNDFNIKNVWQHFWVLLVTVNGKSFEIANPRKDQYNNWIDWKGASDVEIINSIIEDSQRRDFTINQIYYNYKYDYLLDFNNWLSDLINKEINFIWKAEDRINEDVLRILRVYKFIKKWFIASNRTIKSVRSNFHLLCKYWNSERIRETLENIIL